MDAFHNATRRIQKYWFVEGTLIGRSRLGYKETPAGGGQTDNLVGPGSKGSRFGSLYLLVHSIIWLANTIFLKEMHTWFLLMNKEKDVKSYLSVGYSRNPNLHFYFRIWLLKKLNSGLSVVMPWQRNHELSTEHISAFTRGSLACLIELLDAA